MIVKLYRFDKEKDSNSYYDIFNLPISINDEYTVMDLLDYISINLDPTISYYKHSACNHGICGRCLVKLNGKPRLACTTLADSEHIIIEPVSESRVVKDVVVD